MHIIAKMNPITCVGKIKIKKMLGLLPAFTGLLFLIFFFLWAFSLNAA